MSKHFPEVNRDIVIDSCGQGNIDKLVKSPQAVTPAQAGIQKLLILQYPLTQNCVGGDNRGDILPLPKNSLTFLNWYDNRRHTTILQSVLFLFFLIFPVRKDLIMSNFKSLRKPLLSQEVELAIKKAILGETYKAGEKLPSERELVEQFQVSRVTIREAFRNLQSSGLITIKRGVNAGAYVAEPNSDPITQSFQNLIHMGRIDYSHLIDARLYIEPQAAQEAAKYRSETDRQRLHDLLDNAEEMIGRSRKRARLINVSFHCEVAKITGNPIILFITESITQSYSALIIDRTQTRLSRKDIQKFIDDHRSILDSITGQNPAEAYEKTTRHLLETYLTYSRVAPNECDPDMDRRIKQQCSFLQ
jgi:GntR family transcriptional regulator, transcriptional repressor for pyruvate dehydrogenase complex